jgi:hypothetical protein
MQLSIETFASHGSTPNIFCLFVLVAIKWLLLLLLDSDPGCQHLGPGSLQEGSKFYIGSIRAFEPLATGGYVLWWGAAERAHVD